MSQSKQRIDIWVQSLCRELRRQSYLVPYDVMAKAVQSAGTAEDANKTPLNDLVENYLTRSGIGESYFGAAACGNSNFVKRMRGGGRFFPETEAKVRAFIANNPAP